MAGKTSIYLRSHSMTFSWQLPKPGESRSSGSGVNATKGAGHEPDDDFEKAAAKALAAGKEEYEAVERGKFRFVGAIQIRNECLKCHVPNRTSLEDRVGGLAFTIPLKKTTAK